VIWRATEPEEAFQAQQILARLEWPPAVSSAIREGAIMLVQFFFPGDKHEDSSNSSFHAVDDTVYSCAAKSTIGYDDREPKADNGQERKEQEGTHAG
jgi:hypothetical protein